MPLTAALSSYVDSVMREHQRLRGVIDKAAFGESRPQILRSLPVAVSASSATAPTSKRAQRATPPKPRKPSAYAMFMKSRMSAGGGKLSGDAMSAVSKEWAELGSSERSRFQAMADKAAEIVDDARGKTLAGPTTAASGAEFVSESTAPGHSASRPA
eukprot:3104003-Alexandrium_andersonii.AAC.1